MPSDNKLEELIDHLYQCIALARTLKLDHAVHLFQMAAIEVADRTTELPEQPKSRQRVKTAVDQDG